MVLVIMNHFALDLRQLGFFIFLGIDFRLISCHQMVTKDEFDKMPPTQRQFINGFASH